MGTILVVEDNDDIRDMMAVTLELEGHRVVKASDGRQALALLESGIDPRLIVMDLMMPVMTGWELRTALRQDPRFKDIPVVVVSAVGGDITGQTQAGVYLPKPIDVDTLLEVVSDYCDGAAAH